MKKLLIFLLAATLTISTYKLHPTPLQQKYSGQVLQLGSICNIFHDKAYDHLIDSHYYFKKVQKRINNLLECPQLLTFNSDLHVKLTIQRRTDLKSQAYELKINQNGILLSFNNYPGYVYAMETLSQLVKEDTLPFAQIKDEPRYEYRGIMIDTSRHFLKVSTIQRLIQSMPHSKLNMLHWHMFNDQAFSVKINSHPELSQYGAYSSKMVYSSNDIKSLLALAQKNAINIIPQVDSISGMRSWAQSPDWKDKNITINCPATEGFPKYCHQIDPSKGSALQLAQDVMNEIDNLFKNSPYLHLGGSKIRYSCWDSRPSIKNTFMKLHNIKNYDGLIDYWRFELKQSLPPSRKLIYFMDQARQFSAGQNEIIQFNGNTTKDLHQLIKKTKSKVILSGFDAFDLSAGMGDIWSSGPNHVANTWRDIYENYSSIIDQVDQSRILGAQALAWGTSINDDNFQMNVWMRSAFLGQRMWSAQRLPTYLIVAKMVQLQKTLQGMGIDVSPVTSEFCQHKPQKCWPQDSQPDIRTEQI